MDKLEKCLTLLHHYYNKLSIFSLFIFYYINYGRQKNILSCESKSTD
jgi:hypothetical protein